MSSDGLIRERVAIDTVSRAKEKKQPQSSPQRASRRPSTHADRPVSLVNLDGAVKSRVDEADAVRGQRQGERARGEVDGLRRRRLLRAVNARPGPGPGRPACLRPRSSRSKTGISVSSLDLRLTTSPAANDEQARPARLHPLPRPAGHTHLQSAGRFVPLSRAAPYLRPRPRSGLTLSLASSSSSSPAHGLLPEGRLPRRGMHPG